MTTPVLQYDTLPPERKSSRIRGATVKFILETARRKKRVTWMDLTPVLGQKQAQANLYSMRKLGSLILVKAGCWGRSSRKPAVFSINPDHKPKCHKWLGGLFCHLPAGHMGQCKHNDEASNGTRQKP